MDRYEASALFALLGDADQLKITKMTYNHGGLSLEELSAKLGLGLEETQAKAEKLVEGGLLNVQEGKYVAKLALIDELMGFMFHRCGGSCGCSHGN